MHTSVEKHSLRITESCGTLADTSGSIISAPSRLPCAIPERQLRQSPHCRKCALQSLRLPYSLSYSEKHFHFQGSLLKMPPRPSAAAAATPHPLISNERMQHLYVTLLRTKLLGQRNRLRKTAVPLVAREAVVTGTVTHLEKGDAVMPLAGDHLAALARGHALRRVFAGAALPGVLAPAPTAEARFAIATGYALAQQGTKQVALAFSGPAIASLDTLRPSLAYAAAHKLGIVFVIETAADADLSGARSTEPLGLYGIPVDGNDVVAIYRVAQEAILRARRGVGPTLIDCKPWPLDGDRDPVRRLEQSLERRGLPVSKLKKRTLAAFKKELSAATRKRR
jgi:TPP-dependent pyruvate/acetoin dehydrogenase alpha subunit